MKILLGVIVIAAFGWVSHLVFPWWFIVVAAILVGAGMGLKSTPSFLYGFLGVALLWGIYAALLNAGNGGILAGRMGTLLGGISGFSLVLITALLGGLLGGLGSLTGSLGRQLLD